jgi:hypothetical protein
MVADPIEHKPAPAFTQGNTGNTPQEAPHSSLRNEFQHVEEPYVDHNDKSPRNHHVHDSFKHSMQGSSQDDIHERNGDRTRASSMHHMHMHNLSSDDETEVPEYASVSAHSRRTDHESVHAHKRPDGDTVKVTQSHVHERGTSAQGERADFESAPAQKRQEDDDDIDDVVKVKHTTSREKRKEERLALREVDTCTDGGGIGTDKNMAIGMKSEDKEWRATGGHDECVGVRLVLELNYDRVSMVCVCTTCNKDVCVAVCRSVSFVAVCFVLQCAFCCSYVLYCCVSCAA